MFPGSDPEPVRLQYASDTYLRTRQDTHDQFSVPRVDFPLWVLRRFPWRGDERVLDIGAGVGNYYDCLHYYWPDVTYHAVDLSPGMLQQHHAQGNLSIADAQKLPFPDLSFDVIMANHMLYHIPNLDDALIEIRRVLKPDGVLIAATNSVQTMPQIHALFRRGMLLLSSPGKVHSNPPLPSASNFALENGTRILARYFYAVVRHDLPGTLVFPAVEPVMAYLESTRSLREPQLPDSIRWDELMLVMREQVTRVVDHFGEMVVDKTTGVLLASNHGGFIREFADALDRNR